MSSSSSTPAPRSGKGSLSLVRRGSFWVRVVLLESAPPGLCSTVARRTATHFWVDSCS